MKALFVTSFYLALGLAAIATASARDVSSHPVLRLVERSPATLAGTRFHARERVRVSALGEHGRIVRTVTATRAGRFRVSFARTALDPCNTSFRATGFGGSRAELKLPERMCPVRLDPLGR